MSKSICLSKFVSYNYTATTVTIWIKKLFSFDAQLNNFTFSPVFFCKTMLLVLYRLPRPKHYNVINPKKNVFYFYDDVINFIN